MGRGFLWSSSTTSNFRRCQWFSFHPRRVERFGPGADRLVALPIVEGPCREGWRQAVLPVRALSVHVLVRAGSIQDIASSSLTLDINVDEMNGNSTVKD